MIKEIVFQFFRDLRLKIRLRLARNEHDAKSNRHSPANNRNEI